MSKIVSILCFFLTDFVTNILGFLVDFVLIAKNFLPTDPFSGVLDISKEPFIEYMPYVNWFVPLDYAVTLFGAFLNAYGLYICFKYFKKIMSSVLGNSKNPLSMVGNLFK